MKEQILEDSGNLFTTVVGTLSGALGFFLIAGTVVISISFLVYLWSKDDYASSPQNFKKPPLS